MLSLCGAFRTASPSCVPCVRCGVQDKSYWLGEQAAEAHLAEVDLDDMEYDEAGACFSWPCRCSSRFIVCECQLEEQLDTFECDTCALKIRVLYDFVADDEGDEQQQQEAGPATHRGHAGPWPRWLQLLS
eukprot:COSAG06_NODE_9104_length_1985_cov_1.864263_2_plen_130_part_00